MDSIADNVSCSCHLFSLQEGFDGQMTEDNIEIGICNSEGFRQLNPSEIKDYLAAIQWYARSYCYGKKPLETVYCIGCSTLWKHYTVRLIVYLIASYLTLQSNTNPNLILLHSHSNKYVYM